jgi:hypothetical protein
MSRATRTILLAALVVFVMGTLSYFFAMRLSARQIADDDLAWLKREFRLSDAEMQRIRQLHEGYLPKCQEMCGKIAEKQSEVEEALGTGHVPDAKLVELASLRAQCQAQMLNHFREVSRAMPSEQGKRYLAEMQRLTLGFHQDIERSMGVHGKH